MHDDDEVPLEELLTIEQLTEELVRTDPSAAGQRGPSPPDNRGGSVSRLSGQPTPATYDFRLSTSLSWSMRRAFTTSPMLIRPTRAS